MSSTISFEALTQVIDEENFRNAWCSFFLNEEAVREAVQLPPDVINNIKMTGATWNGYGWDSTKAAKKIREMTQLAMVTNKLPEYLNAFLFSLALSAGIDVPQIELTDKGAEVAFRLSERWSGSWSPQAQNHAAGMTTDQAEDEDEAVEDFAWEPAKEPLPGDFYRATRYRLAKKLTSNNSLTRCQCTRT